MLTDVHLPLQAAPAAEVCVLTLIEGLWITQIEGGHWFVFRSEWP